jgi:hypothetical protein
MFWLEILALIIIVIFLLIAVPIAFIWIRFSIRARTRREPEPGLFEYVFVEWDGSARELDAREREYLSKKYEPGDSGRPLIKGYYEDLHKGYLRRQQLPKGIPVSPAPDSQPQT